MDSDTTPTDTTPTGTSTDDGSSADPLDPETARRNPEDAVDALERRVLGGPEHRLDGGYPDDLAPTDQSDGPPPPQDPGTEAAFDVDLDPAEQGSAAAAPRNPD